MAELVSIKIHEPHPQVGFSQQQGDNLLCTAPGANKKHEMAYLEKSADESDFFFKRTPINLKWHNITYTTDDGKEILKGISGSANAGKLTALMGPSGAGKSTILNVLSGYKRSNMSGGSITVNGSLRTMRVSVSCYIMQDDHVLSRLTVRETIQMAGRLKIPSLVPQVERERSVEASIDALGLREQQNSRANQLSGGQRKRLCIAQELVCNPYLIFLDEPTSGLDSSSCLQCVKLLKSLAAEGRTVICTIHQPSSRIFELFDNLYMLADGHCIYEGSTKDLIPFLSKQGLSCPTYFNPADFFMDVASGEHGDWIWKLKKEVDILNATNKVVSMPNANNDSRLPIGHHISNMNLLEYETSNKPSQLNKCGSESDLRGYATSSWNQFKVLTYRSIICTIREPMATHVRLAAHVLVGVLLGTVYYGIGNDASKVFNNSGCLVFALLFLLYTAMMPTLLAFPLEKTIFAREHINSWYSTKMYYLAKTSSDIPFQILYPVIFSSILYWMTDQPNDLWRFALFTLSCIMTAFLAQSISLIIGASSSIQNAVFLGPVALIPFMLFCGFFINLDNIPYYLQWVSSISYFRYCYQSMLRTIYGFNRTELYCGEKFCPFQEPENFLRDMAMDDGYLSVDFAVMWTFFIVFRIMGYYVLYFMVIYRR